MASQSLRLWDLIPAKPEEVYFAWLDSDAHAAMTGGAAEIADGVGARFTAWDGFIEGTTLHLEPGRRIVQAWRTTEFPPGSPDSRLEVVLEAVEGGTTVTILHSEIPGGQDHDYEQGWRDHYFTPMKKYFAKLRGQSPSAKGQAKKSVARKAKPGERAARTTAGAKRKTHRKKSAPYSPKTRGRSRR